jgi:hypothetical protein
MKRGSTELCWVEGTLVVSVGADVLLVDAPPGAMRGLGAWLPHVRAVALTSGRLSAVGGLLPLLCALEPHRGLDAELTLHLPPSDERAPALAEVWMRHWPDRYPLVVDSERPGTTFEVGAIRVTTQPLSTGELARTGIQELEALGLVLQTPDLSVGYFRGRAELPKLERWLRTDLALLEVGVLPWPRTDRPLRLRTDEVAQIAKHTRELWLLGDDGAWLDLPAS